MCKAFFRVCVNIMNNFNENAIIDRVRQLREQFAGPRGKSKFARALGLSASTYSYYENNRIAPIDVLLRICQLTGADLHWLLTGQTAAGKASSGAAGGVLHKIDALLAENPDLAGPVSAFVDLLTEKKQLENKIRPPTQPPQGRPGWIPVLGRTAAGIVHFWDQTILPSSDQAVTQLDDLVKKHIGKSIIGSAGGQVSVDFQPARAGAGGHRFPASLVDVKAAPDEIVQFVQCDDIFQAFPDSFALQIDGDSMSPRINDGDIVILSPSVPAVDGQIAVARVVNQIGVTCKIIRSDEKTVHLIPINEHYETKIVPKADLLWSLAVVYHITF